MKFKIIFIIVFSIILSGCANKTEIIPTDYRNQSNYTTTTDFEPITDEQDTSIEYVDTTFENIEDTSINEIEKPSVQTEIPSVNFQQNLDSWLGEYGFFESWPHLDDNVNYFMAYGICIYKEDKQYYAHIIMDGCQTMARWKTMVQGDDKSINLIFDSYLPDNLYEIYEKGDILFTLKKSGDDIFTYWGEYYPALLENQESGKVYFVKDNIDD